MYIRALLISIFFTKGLLFASEIKAYFMYICIYIIYLILAHLASRVTRGLLPVKVEHKVGFCSCRKVSGVSIKVIT